MLVSSLTPEVILRYISSGIFMMFFILHTLSYDPLGLSIGDMSYVYDNGYWMFVPLLIWSLFDRWYFMASAMVITVFLTIFITIPILLNLSSVDEFKPIFPITVIAVTMPLASFGMYLNRNIKEKHYTTPFNNALKNLGKKYIILFSVIVGFPALGMIPYGFNFLFVYILFYMPVALSCSTVVLLSFTTLSKRHIALFSVVPGALYFCYMLYEILSGSAFGLS